MATAAFMIAWGLVALGQAGTGSIVYQAEFPLIIGDASNPF